MDIEESVKLIDTRWEEGNYLGRGNLVHFSWRFPANLIPNNMRVDQGYTTNPVELFKREELTPEKIRELDDVTLDIDEYIIENGITINTIDNAISMFRTRQKALENPDYMPFFELARPVFLYLLDEKKHDLYYLIS